MDVSTINWPTGRDCDEKQLMVHKKYDFHTFTHDFKIYQPFVEIISIAKWVPKLKDTIILKVAYRERSRTLYLTHLFYFA